MHKRIQKYRSNPSATFGPLYSTEGEAGGGVATATPPAATTAEPATPAAPPADEALGENGKKALERERDARKNLETQMNQMREAFAQALGVKPDKADPAELLTQMQAQMTQMQHQATVDRVARENGLTDPGDLKFLALAQDEAQMQEVAGRLKAAAGPRTPKPDTSQGPQGDTNKPEPKPGIDRLVVGVTEKLEKK